MLKSLLIFIFAFLIMGGNLCAYSIVDINQPTDTYSVYMVKPVTEISNISITFRLVEKLENNFVIEIFGNDKVYNIQQVQKIIFDKNSKIKSISVPKINDRFVFEDKENLSQLYQKIFSTDLKDYDKAGVEKITTPLGEFECVHWIKKGPKDIGLQELWISDKANMPFFKGLVQFKLSLKDPQKSVILVLEEISKPSVK